MDILFEAKNLLKERDKLDTHIIEQEGILKSHGVDMKTPLVDGDGYPAADVDIYTVRRARKALICAVNDREKLTQQIEDLLYKIHEGARENSTKSSALRGTGITEKVEVHRTSNSPFAKIGKVVPDSPAEAAGLMSEDGIIQFDVVHAGNFVDLKQFEPLVKNSENAVIKVTVLRQGRPYRLELTPKKWPGPGLLGCTILPLNSVKIF